VVLPPGGGLGWSPPPPLPHATNAQQTRTDIYLQGFTFYFFNRNMVSEHGGSGEDIVLVLLFSVCFFTVGF